MEASCWWRQPGSTPMMITRRAPTLRVSSAAITSSDGATTFRAQPIGLESRFLLRLLVK